MKVKLSDRVPLEFMERIDKTHFNLQLISEESTK